MIIIDGNKVTDEMVLEGHLKKQFELATAAQRLAAAIASRRGAKVGRTEVKADDSIQITFHNTDEERNEGPVENTVKTVTDFLNKIRRLVENPEEHYQRDWADSASVRAGADTSLWAELFNDEYRVGSNVVMTRDNDNFVVTIAIPKDRKIDEIIGDLRDILTKQEKYAYDAPSYITGGNLSSFIRREELKATGVEAITDIRGRTAVKAR